MDVNQLWLLWATLAVSLLYYISNRRRRVGGRRRCPPGPMPLPLVGNLLNLRGHLPPALARLARTYGPVMMLKMGLTTTVVISSGDAAREAFTKHDRHLAARTVLDVTRSLDFADRSMIWLPSSDTVWKTLRGVTAASIFSPRGLAALRGVRESKVRDLVGYFRGRAGEVVDVRHAVYGCMLSLVSSAFFSVDVVDLSAESENEFRQSMTFLMEVVSKTNVSDFFPFLRPLDLQGWRRLTERYLGRVTCFLDDVIDRRFAADASANRHGDFLDSLLDLVSTGKIVRENVTTILLDVFIAGSDTITATVEWAMAELLRNPSEMAKVRAEMDGALGGKKTVDEPDIARLPYLQAVVKEAMRLHPAAPLLLPHRAVEDGVEVGGYCVPKGSMVIFNVWAIMRDPAAWERPEEFMPERFIRRGDDDEVDFWGKTFEFIPFGSGRRVCAGLPMAERVVPFMLASLLRAFEWRLPDGVSAEELDMRHRFTIANFRAIPLKAVPVVVS
ncbi:cytochrome P450 76M5-like [Oryza sativa Japonica Group]|uniref:Cyt-P450 monooxygenase n=3 Tax=Oryza sativa TaxID=4530 RepID=A3BTY3_ORYSJ|nr:cytochrome P450 76M5-like [Oryza sativa Japonica Group]EAZ07269.1 hypothetical protein OsI_29516 [Oryza sativa Indica Group]KAB8108801.1 hypothetical protein EE612_044771 [Oryza sativa]EAZ43022.1 hypothetical protein OsJ_27609 [Oryza sativa Japonica Group]KAF2920042.1 hypothetical protein DAI22_08g180700 [Oryza sativa Japonica Group]BAD10769.1 putative Cyt-P450 monooxygenase [Oryza sativa Japonica Group]|eukprot:NP_001061997.1 Os08g0465700 [Oryza sativa Japonica Group]